MSRINNQIEKIEGMTVKFVTISGKQRRVTVKTSREVIDKVIDYLEGRKDIHKIIAHFENKGFNFTPFEKIIQSSIEFDRSHS